ncbi:MAG TPA: cysteine synthase A [Ruminococcus sp.]|nr:cysteine synthase A [Ruminococcus sp.]HCR74599.1 cysteine synthase A [Ruminococcus sp.]
MSEIYTSVTQLVGNTPLFELKNLEEKYDIKAKILAKLEYFNPAGSIKDRVAVNMIEDAEKKGLIGENAVIIEPTSGNTGIGLACIAAAKGYRAIFTMPETMSVERRKLLKAYGAEIVLTDGSKGMKGAIEKADELKKEIPGSIILGQFINPANPEIHEKTTGVEIWNDTDGNVDILIAGVGTGGTLTGTGRYLKSKNPDIQVIAVEPADSPVLSQGHGGPHKIQGIGAGFVPKTLDTDIFDKVITAETDESYEMCRKIAHCEGIFVGISSGAAAAAALKTASLPENYGKNIVVIFPDNGEKYLSTPRFI